MLCIRSDPREHGFEGVRVLAPAAVRSLIEERFPVTRACFCNFRLALSNSFATVGMRYLDGIKGVTRYGKLRRADVLITGTVGLHVRDIPF